MRVQFLPRSIGSARSNKSGFGPGLCRSQPSSWDLKLKRVRMKSCELSIAESQLEGLSGDKGNRALGVVNRFYHLAGCALTPAESYPGDYREF